jgi:hypothetical protein
MVEPIPDIMPGERVGACIGAGIGLEAANELLELEPKPLELNPLELDLGILLILIIGNCPFT